MRKFWRPKSSAGVPGSQPPGRSRRRTWPRAGAAALAITAALGLLTAVSSWGATAQAATLQVTTTSLPGAEPEDVYNVQLTATGGTAPYTWSVEDGSLPPGIGLESDGLITGSYSIPTPATYTFTVQVTDSGSPKQTATQQLTLSTYSLPDFTTTALPDATAGVAYSAQLTESGGVPPFTWTLNGSQLPPGLTLNADGVVSGTPTQAGTFTFDPEVTDSSMPPDSLSGPVTLTVNPAAAAPLTVTTTSLPSASSSASSYDVQLTAAGGTAPYTWRVADGSLPPGFELEPDGVIMGAIAQLTNVTTTFTVQVTDSGSTAQTATQQLTMTAYGPPEFTTSTLPDATAGVAYSGQATAFNGETPYTWALTGGQLPPGLTLNADGVVSGTPTEAGTFTFVLEVTDSESPPVPDAQTWTLTVNPAAPPNKADLAVAVTGPATATPGAPVTDTITVTDKGPAAASKVTVDLGTTGLTGVKPSAGGSTKSVTVLGVTLSATTWSLASLAPGQQVTFTVTGTVPVKGIKTASAAGLALSSTPDPNLLNNAGATSTKITG
jgi:large repetitive protein